MVGLLAMTGSASLIGVWAYKYWEAKAQLQHDQGVGSAWWQAAWQQVQGKIFQSKHSVAAHQPPKTLHADALDLAQQTPTPDAAMRYGWHTATLALGVTTTGWLILPPLQIAGLPLLVYMGIPAAQQAYDQLWVDGRPSRALAETMVLAACLAGGYYWVGSLGFWLYYGSRTWLTEKQRGEAAAQRQWLAPTTAHLWKDGAACTVPLATLQPGD